MVRDDKVMNKKTEKKLLKIVEKNYDEIADDYHEKRKKKMSSNLWGELIGLTKDIKDDAKILDVGCGNGRLLELFQNKKIKYLGVDKNEKLISHARELHPDNEFAVANLLELGQVAEHNFDYVFSVAVLHHIPGRDLQVNALKQLKNKIQPDGRIIITVWNMWCQKKFRKLIIRFFFLRLFGKNKMDFGDILFDWKNSQGERVSQRYYHAFTHFELWRLGRKAGLKIEKIKKDKYNYYLVLKKK